MSYEQYWYGDPLMVGAFRKAEKLRQERVDYEAWLHGIYMRDAINSSIGNAFLPKGRSPLKYPAAPLLSEENFKNRGKTVKDEEQEAAFAKLWMTQMCEAGKNWGK